MGAFSSHAFAKKSIFCGNEKGKTLLYLKQKQSNTLAFMNLSDANVALVRPGQLFFTTEYISLTEITTNDQTTYEISAYIADHNFDWEVTIKIDPKSDVATVKMIDTDSYDVELEFDIECTGVLAIRE